MIPTYNGKIIPVITLRPDWVHPVRLGQQYSTSMSEALDTSEERQSRFPRPLYRLNYTTLGLTAAETAYLRTVIETADDLPVGCPLWPLACNITQSIAAGATFISSDPHDDCLFGVFYQFALLLENFEQWEVIELLNVSPGGFGCNAITNSYTTEAMVLPLAYGIVPRGPVSQLTDSNGRWECKFSETFHRLHDQSIPENETVNLFDPAACAVTGIINGGGDTFDCYTEGSATSLPLAGTGFAALWIVGDNPFNNPFVEDFESYSDPSAMNGATGFAAAWLIGDNSFNNWLGDNFDSYPDGAIVTLSNGSGFSANWLIGDGP